MADLSREEAGWALSRVWLDALEDTARDFFGSRPRVFTRRAYEHAAEAWVRIMREDYGLQPREATTLKAGLESYIDLGVRGGLFTDSTEFELDEVTPTRVEVTVHKCPYYDSCAHLLDEGVAIAHITCPRIGCFAAGAKVLAHVDCVHEVHSVNLKGGCKGAVVRS